MMEADNTCLNWQSILGHEKIKNDLQQLLQQDKLPHALLFTGIEGIGKRLMAKTLAKALLTNDPLLLNHSHQAQNFDHANHPDFIYIEPNKEKATPLITIQQIRQMQNTLDQAAYYEGYRVVLIDQAHTLNETAMNALLKTLEEPNRYIVFILISHQREKLLPTILSRCTQLYFGPLPAEVIEQLLLAKYNLEQQQAQLLGAMCNGSITRAEELLEDEHNLRQLALNFGKDKLSPTKIWSYTDTLANLGKKSVMLWGEYLLMYIRDLLCLRANINKDLIFHQDEYENLAIHTWDYTYQSLFDKLALTEKLLGELQTNAELSRALQNFMLKWRKIN